MQTNTVRTGYYHFLVIFTHVAILTLSLKIGNSKLVSWYITNKKIDFFTQTLSATFPIINYS